MSRPARCSAISHGILSFGPPETKPAPGLRMTSSVHDQRLLRLLLGGASAVILLAGARAASGILNPVLMAGFLALLLQPLMDKLRRLRGAAVGIIVFAVVLAALVLAGFLGVSLRQVGTELPQYREEFEVLMSSVSEEFSARGINAAEYLENAVGSVLTGPSVVRFGLNVSGAIAGGLGSLLLTLFIFAFMLSGIWEMERRARVEAVDHSPLAARFIAFSSTIRGYMWVRTILGLAAALLNYILLLVMGVDYAMLWAVLSFFFSFVPNVGFVLSMIPPILLALLERGWMAALIVFIGYQVINTIIDNVVGPRFVGRQMKVSALLSFLSVLFWTWVLGATGAILSVPLTVLIRDLAFPSDEAPGNDTPPDLAEPEPVGPSTVPTPA